MSSAFISKLETASSKPSQKSGAGVCSWRVKTAVGFSLNCREVPRDRANCKLKVCSTHTNLYLPLPHSSASISRGERKRLMVPVQDAASTKCLPRDLLEAVPACSGAASSFVRPPAVGCGSLKNSLVKDTVFISKMKIDVEPTVWRTRPAPPTAHTHCSGLALPKQKWPGKV